MKNMHNGIVFIRVFLLLMILVVFSACLIPEKFTCNIRINADGSYSVSYIGTVVDTDVLIAMSSNTFNENEYRETDLGEMKSFYSLNEASYVNNGRFNVSLDTSSNTGAPTNIFTVMDIGLREGAIIVQIIGSGENSDSLKSLGYKIDGTIKIVSDIPVKDAGGNKVERDGAINVITLNLKELPKNDIVISFYNSITQNLATTTTTNNRVRVSNDWIE